jgi:hypothetical protein
VLRPKTESEDRFRARCAAHERGGNVCRAKVLAKKLEAEGLVPLRAETANEFTDGYNALKEAGLTTFYQTRIAGENYVRPTPWAPRWAAIYDAYLRRKRKIPLTARVAELIEAAATPENTDRVKAFLALSKVELVLYGFP